MASSSELIAVRREDGVDYMKIGRSAEAQEGMRAFLDTRPSSGVEDDGS